MNKIGSLTLSFCLCAVVLLLGESCESHDFPQYVCPPEAVSFQTDIQEIVTTKCAIGGCHNGDLGRDRDWTNVALFLEEAESGQVKSYVVNRTMPPAESPAGPLSQEQIDVIACWVDQGAQNN